MCRNLRFSLFRNTKCTLWAVLMIVSRYKAYSTVDGKEVLFHTIHIGEWKKEVVECFMDALRIVQSYNSHQHGLYCIE